MTCRSILIGATLLMAGCDEREAEPSPQAAETEDQAAPERPLPPTEKAQPTTDELAASRDPHQVVLAWAKAMNLKDWETAYGFWSDGGARSGMSLDQFRTRWNKIANPQFEIAEGALEGAAGSLYYSVPVTLIDGTSRVPGEVVLRRANDVPGATPEQLRWHIERLDLQP